jgi:phosphate transport system substrate-binding protein
MDVSDADRSMRSGPGGRPGPLRATRHNTVLAALLFAVLAACTPEPPGNERGDAALQGRLVITGSSTVAPLVNEIGRRFESRYPGTRIDVQTGGSSRGIADLRRGTAGLGMVSRSLTAGEDDFTAHTIALDGIAMIVHRDNPVSTLSDADIVALFTGALRAWPGSDRPVTVVNKAEGRATLELFLGYFGLDSADIRASIVIGDNQQGIRTVAGDPDAIAYVSIGTALFEAARGTPIRPLPLNGIDATLANVRSGRFALARPLNLVTRGAIPPLTQAFIEFAQSTAVADLVEAQNFVPPSR